MAAVISDFVSDSAHFQHSHTMLTGTNKQLPPAETQYLQISNLREVPPSPQSPPDPVPIESHSPTDGPASAEQDSDETDSGRKSVVIEAVSPTSGSKPPPTRQKSFSQEIVSQPPFSYARSPQILPSDVKTRNTSCFSLNSSHFALPRSSVSSDDVKGCSGNKVNVRNLAHIRSFVHDDPSQFGIQTGQRLGDNTETPTYEISGMPITDVIEMVAGLLTKIVTTNDRQNTPRNRSPQSTEILPDGTKSNKSSVAAFHGKNVPNITILSYLSRIHKYCPTTYEVFLSLLVYFDRMTERVNKVPTRKSEKNINDPPESSESTEASTLANTPPASPTCKNEDEYKSKIHENFPDGTQTKGRQEISTSRLFVVDSYNIHRLVIAGVTCASKFFSDVFYTNSRYAKVGGLPLTELNHLELQFLLINDFRLFVPVEELEVYGTMLLEFYAREIMCQEQGSTTIGDTTSLKAAEPISS